MGFIFPYCIVAAIIVVMALIIYMGEGREGNRKAARIILIAPIWPLMAPVLLFRVFRWLWKTADWKGVEEEEYEHRRGYRGNW